MRRTSPWRLLLAAVLLLAVVTVYGHNSHADVLLTKILEGWHHDGVLSIVGKHRG